ncbi:hypothetical protein HDU97_000703 [Phlyctochytrium planicorne]|nr:hypothetical protein HDU97_000703 [Phlyctochytrium planicorne]
MHVRLGHHTDYIKALAYASSPGWVASGGLDRRIVLWNVGEARGEMSVLGEHPSMQLCHDSSPSASIYALATNSNGGVIVSGSPEKVVKVWDPRSGKREIRLTGHTDNIRSLLVSEDGRWVLSASSDTTIKLWSLAQPQRYLETFWSGGRDGWVTKMTRRRIGGDSTGKVGKGGVDELVDCVAVCREDGGVNKVVALDDQYIWTATNKSHVNRWRDIPFRHATVVSSTDRIPDDTDAIIIPSSSILRQPKPILDDDRSIHSYHFSLTSMEASAPTTASMVPIMSGTGGTTNTSVNDWESDEVAVEPVWLNPDETIAGKASIRRYTLLNNRRWVVSEDTDGRVEVWDIVGCVRLKDCGVEQKEEGEPNGRSSEDDGAKITKKSLYDTVIETESTFEWIANWCTVDTKNGYLTVHLDESKSYDAEMYHEDTGSVVKPTLEDQRINIGRWVLTHLFICYLHAMAQRVPEAATLYRDFYLGALTYTDRAAPPDEPLIYTFGQEIIEHPLPSEEDDDKENDALGLTQWVKPNGDSSKTTDATTPSTLHGSPKKLKGGRPRADSSGTESSLSLSGSCSSRSCSGSPERSGDGNHSERTEPLKAPPDDTNDAQQMPKKLNPGVPTSTLIPLKISTEASAQPPQLSIPPPPSTPPPATARERFHSRSSSLNILVSSETTEDNSKSSDPKSAPVRNGSPLLALFQGNRKRSQSRETDYSIESGGAVANVENLGEKAPTTGVPTAATPTVTTALTAQQSLEAQQSALKVVQSIIANPASFVPNQEEIPPIRLPTNVPIILSIEESSEVGAFLDQFRSTVGGLGWVKEALRLDSCIPKWVYEGIIDSKTQIKDPAKMSFLLVPHPGSNLPELPNNTNRLSSNRMLRIRKLLNYVVENIQIDPPAELVQAAIQELEISSSSNDLSKDDENSVANTLQLLKVWGSDKLTPTDRANADKTARAMVKPEKYLELCCYEKV